MTFASLEQAACALPPEQRRRLIAHLFAIQGKEDAPDRAKRRAQRIDDPSEARWFTPEQAEKELGLTRENG